MTVLSPLGIARREISAIAALAVATGGILVFLLLADEVSDQNRISFDEKLLLALRTGDAHDPIGPPWVEVMFTDLTSLGSSAVLTLLTLCVLGYLLLARKTGTALLVLAAVSGGTILNNVLKYFFGRPRPDLVAHIVDTQTTSFPSGHAMISAATYLTLAALIARVQSRSIFRIYIVGVAVFITLLIGVSRVYLGVHWPSDVLAGWCAGASWAILCWLFALFLQRRRALPDPSAEPAD
ncbi:phosphatase PAP2 family protein [Terrihabitans sp. B22-R8]|uniref:phosphatase PAP2 family protein n=1 Tax=Terrihabitans sp. B22-R8 TaxID=3425128 RepID=UPI00403D3965